MISKPFVLTISLLLVLTTPFLARAKGLNQTRSIAKATLRKGAPQLFSKRVSCNTVITTSGKFNKLCRRHSDR
ncbi:MAG: hypothetical protein J7647_19310 [Cyanobacteria bacterium SBLK]|nr:hypothetical protein [Cyanobacteria bacterium SBLK]